MSKRIWIEILFAAAISGMYTWTDYFVTLEILKPIILTFGGMFIAMVFLNLRNTNSFVTVEK